MTDEVNSKLLVALGLTVVVAAFGFWRLMTVDDTVSDAGFDQPAELSAILSNDADASVDVDVSSLIEPATQPGRNPFARADEVDEATSIDAETGDAADQSTEDAGDGSGDDSGTDEPSGGSVATNPAPVFPDPNLVDQEAEAGASGRSEAADDSSFEG